MFGMFLASKIAYNTHDKENHHEAGDSDIK